MAHLLIIEDHETTRKILFKRLAKAGHEVYLASSGKEGIKAFNSRNFDLVVIDFMMKHMNGLQAFEHMKALRPGIPFVLLSAYANSELVQQFLGDGGADFIVKPFHEDLEERLSRIIDLRTTQA